MSYNVFPSVHINSDTEIAFQSIKVIMYKIYTYITQIDLICVANDLELLNQPDIAKQRHT